MRQMKETLCWRCARAGTEGCSWDKNLTPVEGWTAQQRRFREQTGVYTQTYLVERCPLFEEERDYKERMDREILGAKRGPKLPEVRERIYQLIRNGFRNEAIALELGIAVEMVKKYRTEWNKLREAER